MSKSRLEKFLYALYSLDSSDLPNPLSRIEELYKCLVTGDEAPTFKPLSRVEKYLMAILGAYDVDELPNPLSRVEVLLYKLATGDDNLDDVKSFLSEHEELLAEIIRNGGVGGNIDIEYVLYTLSTEFNTLYNTAEKPVKSAILKGNSLINLLSNSNINIIKNSVYSVNYVYNLDVTKTYILRYRINQFPELSDTSGRLLKFEWYSSNKSGGYSDVQYKNITAGTNNFIIINPFSGEVTKTSFSIWCPYYVSGNLDIDIMIIEYQDGMENWDIPYFEGMQSVKMPVLTTIGKNLFDGELKVGGLVSNGAIDYNLSNRIVSYNFIPIKNNMQYKLSSADNLLVSRICFYDNNKQFISQSYTTDFISPTNAKYLRFAFMDTENIESQIMLEEGSTASTYEPYKTNILTVNEEVELHGISDVRDELNPFTGELTQRIGEFVFDGDERFKMSTSDNNAFFYHELGGDMLIPSFTKKMISNNLLDYANYATMKSTENSMYTNGKSIYIHLTNDINSVSLLQTYLANNPIKIITCLSNESVKTVDLSVVNQDGNDTKLSTFNDITHVTLSSEGLIPEAELEVATKNEEDLEDSSVYTAHTLSEEFNTLYNTAEKPVKSAILKGNTLTNLSQSNGEITLTPNSVNFVIDGSTMIKSNTTYTVSFNCLSLPSTNFIEFRQAFDNTALKMENISVVQGHNKFKVTTVDKEVNRFRFKNDTTSETDFVFNNIMIIEGDYTNIDIPYFEGMQSVKMPVLKTTGKNLYSYGDLTINNPRTNAWYYTNGKGASYGSACKRTDGGNWFYLENGVYSYHSINENTQTTIVLIGEGEVSYNPGKEVPSGWYVFRFKTKSESVDYIKISQLQLEKGPNKTTYEPYKSNILTTSEEVELRGIGTSFKDELNLLTGELTKRVGEIVLDGSENWSTNSFSTSNTECVIFITTISDKTSNWRYSCDRFKTGVSDVISVENVEGVCSGGGPTGLFINVSKTKASTVEDFKNWLSNNNVTIQYQSIESVKTVDLSVVNQDGNNTKLSTFDDLTHVTLSSEGLIPEAELEVAEKVTEVAASMLTISREQEVIDTTTNKQSETVDATMIATTEIYEGLL